MQALLCGALAFSRGMMPSTAAFRLLPVRVPITGRPRSAGDGQALQAARERHLTGPSAAKPGQRPVRRAAGRGLLSVSLLHAPKPLPAGCPAAWQRDPPPRSVRGKGRPAGAKQRPWRLLLPFSFAQ